MTSVDLQSNLRKQIRKLPKILKSVKIVHYISLLFIRVLSSNRRADRRLLLVVIFLGHPIEPALRTADQGQLYGALRSLTCMLFDSSDSSFEHRKQKIHSICSMRNYLYARGTRRRKRCSADRPDASGRIKLQQCASARKLCGKNQRLDKARELVRESELCPENIFAS